MTISWWSLGEGSGYDGEELAVHRITCPFCLECGNFCIAFHAEKKKPNGSKVLNFDTLQCGSCAAFVMVLWSAGDRLHDFRVLPWPQRVDRHPEHWPADVGRYWIQAQRCLRDENWDAAALMARSAMQIALRVLEARGANLKQEIDDLSAKGLLPPAMAEWAAEVREIGNRSAHPGVGQGPTVPDDAREVVRFLDFLLEYHYDLPQRIAAHRRRREGLR